MQARRVLLFLGIMMLLAVAAASLLPPPQQAQDDRPEENDRTGAVEPPPAFRANAGEAIEVEFRAAPSADEREVDRTGGSDESPRDGADDERRDTRSVGVGEHVIVTVMTPKPGEVELEGLGLLQTAAPGVPAVFDLFTDEPGTYPVLYTPVSGEKGRIGALVVEEEAADNGGGG